MNEAKAKQFIELTNTEIPLTDEAERTAFTQLRAIPHLMPADDSCDTNTLYVGQYLARRNSNIPPTIKVPPGLALKVHIGMVKVIDAVFMPDIEKAVQAFLEEPNPFAAIGALVTSATRAARMHKKYTGFYGDLIHENTDVVASFAAIQAIQSRLIGDLGKAITENDEFSPQKKARSLATLKSSPSDNNDLLTQQLILFVMPSLFEHGDTLGCPQKGFIGAKRFFEAHHPGGRFMCPAYVFMKDNIFTTKNGESVFSRVLNAYRRHKMSGNYNDQFRTITDALKL